jgi:hypothetical protein
MSEADKELMLVRAASELLRLADLTQTVVLVSNQVFIKLSFSVKFRSILLFAFRLQQLQSLRMPATVEWARRFLVLRRISQRWE